MTTIVPRKTRALIRIRAKGNTKPRPTPRARSTIKLTELGTGIKKLRFSKLFITVAQYSTPATVPKGVTLRSKAPVEVLPT